MLPTGIGLGAAGIALLMVGFLARLGGARGPVADLLSMDAPGSPARLVVAAVLAMAAVVAALGARRDARRRAWWTGVAVAVAVLALAKALGTVHAAGDRGWPAVLVLGALSVIGLALLWLLRGDDRRDRCRVAAALAAHALAAVGLSAVSGDARTGGGNLAYAAATFVEESVEGFTAVVLLVVVVIGVLPRVVPPAGGLLGHPDEGYLLELQDVGVDGVLSSARL